ncbi:glycoside hydrolase superfamily [Achaetomium macrosporum]|uniref:beta-galactosidase n=1 Tax=Achaetomium macrosporum TaxID=79813 RepID=A0AAN7C3W1_9PEZI|nr:glycoside hydrolase superfamily [Achaetomium macrosporum]
MDLWSPLSRLFPAVLLTWTLFALCFQLGCSAANTSTPWPLLDNGLQHTVQWDHYSLLINGERLFLFGGEMHPFRLPVPELWEDILQKIEAMGMRMVSIYTHWGFHAPTPDSVDFRTGAHNLTCFLEMARDVGLYVMVRPGPYINGELSAGGMALWSTTGAYGTLRLNGTAYTHSWTPYQDGIARVTRPFQITENGTVIIFQIENEYGNQWRDMNHKIPNWEAISYVEKLEDNARKNGIVVPLTHNAPNQNGRAWSKDYDTVGAGGDVDIYGLDSYPQCWSCVTSECGSQPPFMPEFQGGAMNPWDGPAGGCQERTGVDFVNFYYRDNIAQRVTMLNLHMIYGGTNWGWLAAPFMGTSYDYSAAISEDRSIGDKFYEIKNLGLFTRVADELAFTDWPAFYVIRHVQTASASEEWFAIKVNTSIGEFYVPKISSAAVLSGNEGKILVADFHFGNQTLYYATAEVLTYSIIDGKEILVLWTPSGRSGEFYLNGATTGTVSSGQSVTFVGSDHGVIVANTQRGGLTVLEFDNGVRIILVDRKTAYKVWVPALTKDPGVPVDQTALVVGPYLVCSATLTGTTIRWNGADLPTTKTNRSTLVATIPQPRTILVPKIVDWKSHDSLPERDPSYSDAGPAWVLANDTTSPNPAFNLNTTTKPYLFADQYGFHTGIRLWRAHFSVPADSTSPPTGVCLSIQGGTAHGWSAYLNGVFLGSWLGDANADTSNPTLPFPANSTLLRGGDNVLLVIHDDTGHDQGSAAVAGTAGASSSPHGTIDALRTRYNEGGLTAERLGWHLPNFNPPSSFWESRSAPSEGFPGPGVRFYRGTLPLHIPRGLDVSLAFRFQPPLDPEQNNNLGYGYRVLLFVNGWQYGRYYPSIASEDTFPVPAGVLDYEGQENMVGLAVGVEVVVRYAVESGFDSKGIEGGYLRGGWEEVRREYA